MKPILIVDCYLDDPAGGTPSFAKRTYGRPWESVRAPRAPLPVDPTAFQALYITGSAASMADRPDWVAGVVDLVRASARERVPVFGVCFGHQVIGAALAGDPWAGKAPRPEVGWVDVDVLRDDPLFDGVPRQFKVFVSHEDEVHPNPPGLDVLARSEQCPVHAIRAPGLPIWGVQFHPEMAYDEAARTVRSRATRHPELGLDPDAVLAGASISEELCDRLFRNFLRAADQAATLST
jgi:GMP synthase-like glutamine amidotransferase